MKRHGLQLLAIIESVVGDGSDPSGDDGLGDTRLIEGILADAGHACRDVGLGQIVVVAESIVANGGQGGRHLHICQLGVAGARAVAGHAVLLNLGDTVGQQQTLQCGHIVEHILTHHVVLRLPVVAFVLLRHAVAVAVAVVVLTASHDLCILDVEFLEVGHHLVQVVNVGAVDRTGDLQSQHVASHFGRHLLCQLSAGGGGNVEFLHRADGDDVVLLGIVVGLIVSHHVGMNVEPHRGGQ